MDGVLGTAELDLYVEGVLETTYSYVGGNCTLSVRANEATLSLPELEKNINRIEEWKNGILGKLSPPTQIWPEFILELEFESNEIKLKMKYEGYKFVDAIYTMATGNVVFQPRTEVVMSLRAFRYYAYYLALALRMFRGVM